MPAVPKGSPRTSLSSPNSIVSDLDITFSVSATGDHVASADLRSHTLTIPAGRGSAGFSVATVADNVDEPSGTVTVKAIAGTGYRPFDNIGATVTIDDDDRGTATLSVPAGNIDEADGSKTLTLTLNRALVDGENLSLSLAFGGDVTLGEDFTLAAPGTPPTGVTYALAGDTPTVTFEGPSAASATVILNTTDDSRDEGDSESVSVKLAAVSAADTNLGGGVGVSGAGAFAILDDDEQLLPEVSIAPTSGNAVTEGGNASFTLSLDPAPEAAIEVNVSVTDAANSDFLTAANQGARKIEVAAGATSKVFTVATQGDSADEASAPIRARVTSGDGYDVGAPNSAEARVTDNDASRVTLATPDASAREGDAADTASISLTLNRGLANGETLETPLAFTGGAPGDDFTLACPSPRPAGVSCANLGTANAAVTFTGPSAGLTATSVTLTLTVIDDTDTDHERVTVSIPSSISGNPSLAATGLDGGVSGVRSGNGEIVLTDDDTPPPPEVSLSVNNAGAVTEGGALTVTAEVSKAPSGSLSIPLQRVAADSTAEAGDYTLAANITIANGATSGTATLTARSDNDDEVEETLRVQLGAPPEGYVNGADSFVDIAITDATATRVTLTTPDTTATEADAADTAAIKLTLGRGLEGSESLIVPLQFSGGTPGTDFDLALSGTPTGVSFDAATGEVTFAGPSASASEATVLLTATVDANAADATVTVSIPSSSTAGNPRLTAANLDGGATGSRTGNGRITLKDAGLNVRTIGWAATSLAANETASAGSVNVELSSSGATAITFRVCLTDGTATLGNDFEGVITAADRCTGSNGRADFTIAAGATTQAVNFASIVDAVDEADETYTATISLPTAVAGLGISPATLNVTIRDDDATEVSLARTGSGAINEGGKVEFTVALSRALKSGETIDAPLPIGGTGVTTGDWSLAGKSGATNTGVTLLATNTATPTVRFSGTGAETATLELTAIADNTGEGSGETFSIALGSNQQFDADPDTNVGGGADPHGSNKAFTVLVNDPRTIGWAATSLNITESDSQQTTGTVNASLSTGNGPVAFRVCLADGTASRGSDYRGFSGNACTGTGGSNPDREIASGQSTETITFTVNGDTIDEPNETFTADLSLPSAVTGLSVDASRARATATIVDNDPTVVSLARVGSGAIYEAGRAEFTVTLGRRLVAGEVIDVPLSVGGNNITTGDWSLARKPGASNTGVTLGNTNTNTPNLRFSGANARVATLELKATVDGATESGGETLTFALGPDGTGTNGFDRSGLGTNVGGGADPHNTNHSVSFTVNDGRTIGWANTALTVNESSNAVNLNAELSAGTGPVSFRVCLADDGAIFGEDFTGVVRANARCTGSGAGNADPSISSGASSRQVSPGIDQRILDEPRETFTATLSLPTPIAGLSVDSASATTTVTIVDKDPTLVTLSASSGNVAENGGVKEITLSLGRALVSPESLTVPLSFGGVAGRGSEYTVACPNAGQGVQCANLNSGNASVTFTGGANAARTVTLTVTGIEDNVEEGSESVTVDLGALNSGSGTNLDGGASGSGSVSFDVAEEATIGFASDAFVVDEGAGDWYATVRLSEPVQAKVRADVAVEAGSADGGDYRLPYPLHFDIAAGDATGRFGPIAIRQDTRAEGDETFYLKLVRARDISTGRSLTFDRAEASVTIRDDEPAEAGVALSRRDVVLTEGGAPGSYTVALRLAPTSDVSLTATVEDAGAARIHTGQGTPAKRLTLVFTPQNWDELRTIVVTPQDDADADEERPYIEHLLSGAGDYERPQRRYLTVVVRDDDEPPTVPVVSITGGNAVTEGGRARFTLEARPVPQGSIDVSVDVVDSGDFAVSGQDGPRTVTIGADGRATLEVLTDDDSQEEDDGRFTATLAAGAGYTVDPQQDSASVVVNDNDTPPTPIVSFDQASSSAGEASGTRNVTLDLSPPPASAITVRYGVGGTATEGAGNDFTIAGSGSLQVPAGASTATIAVAINDDNSDEANETVELTLTDTADYDPGAPGSHTLTITDNDDPPPATPVVSIAGGNIITEGGTASFTLTANPPPQSAISVNVNVVDSGDFADSGQAGARRVSIGAGGAGTLTVRTDDDSTDEPGGTLTATVASGQGYSPSNTRATASVTVKDDDDPPPMVSISGGNAITEGDAASFTLTASPPPSSAVTVNVNVVDSGDFADSGQAGSRTVNIGVGGTGTLTVGTDDDGVDELDGAITATVKGGAGYEVDTLNDSDSVTVSDNDEPLPIIRINRDDASVAEGVPASFTVTADRAPAADLTVHLNISQNGDFAVPGAIGAQTVTIYANTATANHSVATIDDNADEADGSITARVLPRSHYRVARAPASQAAVAITDNDVPVPELRITSEQSAFETDFEGAELVFTLRANIVPEADIDVTVNVAQPGNAFVDSSQTGRRTVTLRANRRAETFTVPTTDDNIEENPSHATVTVTVRTGAGYTVARSPKNAASAEVHDNDGLPIVSILDAEAEEGDDLDFHVELSKPVAHEVEACFRPETGQYQGRDYGNAGHPADFIYKGRCITVRPGRTTGEDWFETVDDNHDEGDEWFTIVLWRAEGATIGDSEAIATIRNSDPLPDAWLARFGRAVAEQALEGITTRIETAQSSGRTAGFEGNIAGKPIGGPRLRQPGGCAAPPGPGMPANSDASAKPAPITQPHPGPAAESTRAAGDPASTGCGPRGFVSMGDSDTVETARFPNATDAIDQPGAFPTIIAPIAAASAEQNPGGGTRFDAQSPYGGTPEMMLRQLLTGSHFSFNREQDDSGGILGFWGRGAVSSFTGTQDALQIDGDIGSAMFGADYVRGDWLFGLALTQTLGDGGYAGPDNGSGTLESTLTAAIPYAAWDFSESLSLWGAAGHGGGNMTLNPGERRKDRIPQFSAFAPAPQPVQPALATSRERLQADIGWSMASLGLRGEALGPGGGPTLAVVSDALWTRTTSSTTEGMMAGSADVSRLRLGVEGSWMLRLGGGSIRPKLEAGLRHDGGDAETGFGLEVGGGLAWQMPALGLSLDIEGRRLLLHEAEGRSDLGFSASMSWDPGPESKLGPKFSLRQDLGGQSSGGLEALFSSNPITDRMGMAAESRWTAEAGWGFAGFARRFLLLPSLGYGVSGMGRDYSLGWALEPLTDKAPTCPSGSGSIAGKAA